MEIKCLDPLGINAYEREANEKLQPRYNNFFDKKGTKGEHTVKNKYFMPILQQFIE